MVGLWLSLNVLSFKLLSVSFSSFLSHFYNLWSQHAIKKELIFSMLTLEVMKEVCEKDEETNGWPRERNLILDRW